MSDIVLATINAKYIHASFGLRYLLANLGELRSSAAILEFDSNQRTTDMAEALLAHNPKVIGLGVYIWNVQLSTDLVAVLKRIAPDVAIVLGGPEVSYETTAQAICQMADFVVTGEADLAFAELARSIIEGNKPAAKVIAAALPELESLELPYRWYSDRDIAHRIIYVEASRGCPFTCEFCLSSLDVPVRAFALEKFLREMEELLKRGVRHFKFVDRTFNLNLNSSKTILEFFLARQTPDLFLHFEMVPDRLPEALREIIAQFPVGMLQFEVGIQTFNEEVGARIKRRQNYERLAENFAYLRSHTGVHIHADLIVGLPGETMESFAAGFDRLVKLRPQEIQVGILKRLRGTPIVRHDVEWEMVYHMVAPYELLSSRTFSFSEMQKMRRFSRHWDLFVNSGNFSESAPLLWAGGQSPFGSFLKFSQWLHDRAGRTHSIALGSLVEFLFIYLKECLHHDARSAAEAIYSDYVRGGRSDVPMALRDYLQTSLDKASREKSQLPRRQARHLAAALAE